MSNISPRPEQSTTTEAELLTSINELSNSAAGEFIRKAGGVFVNATPGATSVSFIGLTDTPANYTDAASKTLKVNAGGDAIEFVDVATGATAALDNLASVAINTSLVSDTTNTDDLGSSTKL
ncbi:MAG: hypothetical protein PHZ27_04330 [Candidatus Omnitrophica bacterium]|nr:hypothetical protein [Candidatus Omnitrophota bacterium]